MPRIVCISDTHELHESLGISRMPKGDILIHAGDFTNIGNRGAILEFGTWLRALDYEHKVVIAGNHDKLFEKDFLVAHKILKTACPSVRYMQDDGCEVMGLKMWGSPWQPEFMGWAFNVPRGNLWKKWEAIPPGLDVLVTHGPPSGGLGGNLVTGEEVGDEELYKAIFEKRPRVHICGHIHPGYGKREKDGITFVNAALFDSAESFRLTKGPIVIDL